MNKIGYQLIEPTILSEYNHLNISIKTNILFWITHKLKQAFSILPIRIDIIVAEYTSKYPCIGVHYIDESMDDVSPLINSEVNNILASSFKEYFDFISENQDSINKFIDQLND